MFRAVLVDDGEVAVLQSLDTYNYQVSIDAKFLMLQSRRSELTPLQLHHLVSHVNYAWKTMAANPLVLLEGHWPDDGSFVLFSMDLHSSRSSQPEVSFEARFLSNLFANLRDGTPSYKTTRRGALGERALRRAFFSVSVWVDAIEERKFLPNSPTSDDVDFALL